MARSNAAWGIDIGQCALKALRCRPGDQPNQVVADAFDYIEYPKILSQPEADSGQLVKDAIKEFLSRNSVRGDRVEVSVPGQSGLARFIKLPPVESNKIPDIVKYEAKQQIPFALEDVVWDYQQMSGGSEQDGFSMEIEVGLFAMKRDQVFRSLKPFTDARIEVDVVQLTPLAVYNYVVNDLLKDQMERVAEGEAPESLVILSVGTDTTDLVVTNGFRVWQRSIPVGGSHFTKALSKEMKLTYAKAEHLKRNVAQSQDPRAAIQAMRSVFNDLVTEVQRSIGFFKSIDRTAKIGRIIALGNAMKLPGVQKFLSQNLGQEVEVVRTFSHIAGEGVIDAPAFKSNLLSFAPCYGLAVQALGQARLATNLIPREIVKQRLVRSKKPWTVAAAAALLLGCTVNYYGYWRSWASANTDTPAYRSAFSAAQGAAADVSKYQSEFDASKAELEQVSLIGQRIVGNVEGRQLWLELVKAINSALPKVDTEEPLASTTKERSAQIGKRPTIHITKMIVEHFNTDDRDLSVWLDDTTLPPPAPGGAYGAGGGGGFDDFEEFDDEEPEEAAEEGVDGEQGNALSGPGYVIELHGHHFYNQDIANQGAQFVTSTFIKNLEEGTVDLPAGLATQPGQVVPEEEVKIADLGVSHPVFRRKSKIYDVKIIDPAAEPPKPPEDGKQDVLNLMPEDPVLELRRFDFILQFAWQPTPRSKRLQIAKQRAEAARQAAEEAELAAQDGSDESF